MALVPASATLRRMKWVIAVIAVGGMAAAGFAAWTAASQRYWGRVAMALFGVACFLLIFSDALRA
jgi:hypothetical protein